MQTFPHPDTTDIYSGIEPSMKVSMLEDHLVIRPPTEFDLETTEVLVIAAASAVSAGSLVMIDLDPATTSHQLMARRPLGACDGACVSGDGPVKVLGAGYVRLRTSDAYWTIDLAHGGLCRSNDEIELHFLRPHDWTRIQALWVSQHKITVLTDEGTYMSTQSAWTPEFRTAV